MLKMALTECKVFRPFFGLSVASLQSLAFASHQKLEALKLLEQRSEVCEIVDLVANAIVPTKPRV